MTNNVDGTPVAGALAHASTTVAGNITDQTDEGLAVGRFLTGPDADGYCKVEVNLP